MNWFKKQLKDFWSYHRLTNYGTSTSIDKGSIRSDTAFFIAIFIGIITFSFQFNLEAKYYSFEIIPAIILMIGISMGIATRNKTALVNVAPFTPKQRVAFTFLVTFFRAIVGGLIIIALSWLFVLFVALLSFLISGENIFTLPSSPEDIVNLSAYANWTKNLGYAFLIFSTFALSHINNNKTRNIAAAVWLASSFVGIVIANSVMGYIVLGKFKVRIVCDLLGWVDEIPHPWVPLLIIGILAALSLAAAIYMVILRHKSSKL